jgi:hypothetical protein
MKKVDIRIRNVLGIDKVDLSVSRIALVAGHNAAGKSSLLDAVGAAVTNTPLLRSVTAKKDGAAILHDGAELGSVRVTVGDSSTQISYPDCQTITQGTELLWSDPIVTGTVRFLTLKASDRFAVVMELVGSLPTRADLDTWLASRPEEDRGRLGRKALDELWALIEDQGWDVAHKKAKEYTTKVKGRWEQITGATWGPKKALTWVGPDLEPDETYDQAALDAAVAAVTAAEEHRQALSNRQAVDAEREERLRLLVADLPKLREEMEDAVSERKSLEKENEALIAERKNAPANPGSGAMMPCPHCQGPLEMKRTGPSEWKLEAGRSLDKLSSDEIKQRRLLHAGLDGRESNITGRLATNGDRRAQISVKIQQAEKAGQELEVIDARRSTVGAVPAADVEAAETALRRARARVTSIERTLDAKKQLLDWQRQEVLVALLSPDDGVRTMVARRGLETFNAEAAEHSARAGFDTVALTSDMEVTLGGRPYGLLSESERWRADLVTTTVFAARKKPVILLVDRFDVLHPQARPKALQHIAKVGIPAIIAMTAKDAEVLPALEKAGLGQCWWIDGGSISPV